LSIHGKVTYIKAILLPKLTYPSSVISTPSKVIKELNLIKFRFSLFCGKGRIKLYEGGLKMIDYETIIKTLRMNWLERI